MKILDYFNFLVPYIYAQSTGQTSYVIKNPLKSETLAALTADLLTLVYQVGLPIVVVMIVYSGFLYVKARGNPSEINAAHNAIKYTLIGTAIVLGASVISIIIKGTIENLAK